MELHLGLPKMLNNNITCYYKWKNLLNPFFGGVNTAELRFGIFLHVPPNNESSYLKFGCSVIK